MGELKRHKVEVDKWKEEALSYGDSGLWLQQDAKNLTRMDQLDGTWVGMQEFLAEQVALTKEAIHARLREPRSLRLAVMRSTYWTHRRSSSGASPASSASGSPALPSSGAFHRTGG